MARAVPSRPLCACLGCNKTALSLKPDAIRKHPYFMQQLSSWCTSASQILAYVLWNICTHIAVQLKFILHHSVTRSAAVRPPRHLCYRPAVFFRHYVSLRSHFRKKHFGSYKFFFLKFLYFTNACVNRNYVTWNCARREVHTRKDQPTVISRRGCNYLLYLFDIQRKVRRDIFLQYKPTRCIISQIYLAKNSNTLLILPIFKISVWQIPIAVNTVLILLMMDSKSVRNM